MSEDRVPVAIGVVDGGVGINFGRKHGLQEQNHKDFLYAILRNAGFSFPETVRFERNKSRDGKDYVDWMRLRISSDECQVNSVSPGDAVIKIRQYLLSPNVFQDFGVEFEVA